MVDTEFQHLGVSAFLGQLADFVLLLEPFNGVICRSFCLID